LSAAELHRLGAVEAVRRMRAGELRAEDYAAALLERASSLAHLNAFITLDAEQVLEDARRADRERAAGRANGLLHGLPIPVKDSVHTSRLPTTQGTRALAAFRPREDAGVVRRLLDQGAIVMGKTNLMELSRGWTSNNLFFGAVLNPHDPARVPGGSSGGSAAAVAAGIAPLAVGEDTWGSIRVPAAWCGIAGLRPTHGRYSNVGVMPLTRDRFDQVGPMARRVADLALFDACVADDDAPVVARPLTGARIGIPLQLLEGLDAAVEAAVEEAWKKLEAAGAVLVRAALPEETLEAADIATRIIAGENVAAITEYLHAEGTGVSFEQLLSTMGANIGVRYEAPPPTQADLQEALRRRQRLIEAVDRHYAEQRIEALAFPPLLAAAPPLGDNPEVPIRGTPVALREIVGRNTALGNVASLASLVLCAGLTAARMPVGIEFAGPRGSDRRLLALGVELERALGGAPEPRA
jgi:mandelamide amidase